MIEHRKSSGFSPSETIGCFAALFTHKSVQMNANVGGGLVRTSYIQQLAEAFVSVLHTEISPLFSRIRWLPIKEDSLRWDPDS